MHILATHLCHSTLAGSKESSFLVTGGRGRGEPQDDSGWLAALTCPGGVAVSAAGVVMSSALSPGVRPFSLCPSEPQAGRPPFSPSLSLNLPSTYVSSRTLILPSQKEGWVGTGSPDGWRRKDSLPQQQRQALGSGRNQIEAWMCWKTDLQSLESKEAAWVTWPEGGGGPGMLVGVGDAGG